MSFHTTINDWFKITTLKNRSFTLEIRAEVDLRYPRKDKKKTAAFIKNLSQNLHNEKFILDQGREGPMSTSDLIAERHMAEINQYNEAGVHTFLVEGILQPQNPVRGFTILINDQNRSSRVVCNRITYIAKFVVTVTETPIESIKSYRSNDERLVDIIRFESATPLNPDQSFEIIGIQEGKGRKIGVRIVDKIKK
jgi:hypothetical protein